MGSPLTGDVPLKILAKTDHIGIDLPKSRENWLNFSPNDRSYLIPDIGAEHLPVKGDRSIGQPDYAISAQSLKHVSDPDGASRVAPLAEIVGHAGMNPGAASTALMDFDKGNYGNSRSFRERSQELLSTLITEIVIG